jgi:threonine dehydrogenase-like Zn-dependent dehydrogenase
MSKTMKAVIFKGPLKVEIEDRPVPTIQDPQDIILKVEYSALCGRLFPHLRLFMPLTRPSELHVFRGHQPSPTGFIMGHEFTGYVHEAGSDVKTLKVGDRVVCPFTISWCVLVAFGASRLTWTSGECFYCAHGFSSRCAHSRLFGTAALDGGQAEYVLVPRADACAVAAPPAIDARLLVLMADIWPTGWFAADNAFAMAAAAPSGAKRSGQAPAELCVVVLGCGPVGLCAVANAAARGPRHLFAVDSVPARLEQARALGAEPLNFATDRDGLERRVRDVTEGRGADAVIEVVGNSPALRLGFDILRPWGVMSSVGVHNGEVPWTGNEAYGKNIRIQMGRCPVRSIFPQALEMLEKKQHLLG